MKKLPLLLALQLLIFLISTPQLFSYAQSDTSNITLSLDQAIQMALDKNWDILLAQEDIRKAEEQINEAYSTAYPNISFTGRYTRNLKLPVLFIPPNSALNPTSQTMTFELGSNNSYDATISLVQPLFNMKVNTAIKIADQYAEYSRKNLATAKLQTTLNVKKAFYTVLLMKELVNVAQKAYESAEANYKNVELLYKQGVASEYDYLRTEVQKANLLPQLTQSENGLRLAKDYLKNLLNIDITKTIEVTGDFSFNQSETPDTTVTFEERVGSNPIVQQLSLYESLLDKNKIIEESEFYPSLAFFSQYQWQTQDNTFKIKDYQWANSFFIGLQLSYNIFDGFRRNSRIQQVSIDKQKVTLNRRKLEEGVKIQIQQAVLKMDEAKKRIAAQERNVQHAEKTLTIAMTRYKSGVGTQLEIIDTQTAVVFSKTNYAQAAYDYLIAQAEWEFAISKEYK